MAKTMERLMVSIPTDVKSEIDAMKQQDFYDKSYAELYRHIIRMMNMPTEKPRYCITVDDEMLKEIDDFRFGNRYNSRSQATLELIRLGLQALKEQKIVKENSEEGE